MKGLGLRIWAGVEDSIAFSIELSVCSTVVLQQVTTHNKRSTDK